ncbi:MAG: 2-isopropylmalate synthase [Candidatus Marinimicrobia bacterium]|nr:2-isopropylmalate synthase [Candidatus Neomarinimicrobiota bacterium]MBL7009597.1 2-isopropylmalate synthase [Candidatus Neomarinimicrobiota bacterium]MBL7029660.1 2-isopropylmalate synthase [Candidatus Neomarinimicrobiota bacterium]
MKDKIVIFDTTLRDGEQAPGASLNMTEKIEIAKQLNRLNVDVIEAGFPVSSKVQFDSVQRIADAVDTVVAGLARTVDKDIIAANDALKHAETFRIHTFAGTSDIHMLGKFGSDRYGKTLTEKRNNILQMSCDAVALAKTFTDDVEFSPEDAGRTDIGYLSEIVEAVIAAGATTVNIPDTTGYTMPLEFGQKISALKERVSNIDQAVISVHCHNDLGLAVANSLSAVTNGARQVECTINGIGERAGNASLEEIAMAIAVREDLWDVETDINTSEIFNASRMVSSFTGMIVQPNKAIVGENAFAHESGIHQDGMLKDNKTYEIMSPEQVGVTASKIVLGRHSGRHGLASRLIALGFSPSEEELNTVYQKFLDLADKKKEVFDDDLRMLMGEEVSIKDYSHHLDYLHVNLGTTTIPTATVRIKTDGKMVEESATGDGPVDACFNAIDRALNSKFHIESYQVRSVTVGRSAQGEAHLKLKSGDKSFSGRGVSTDIVEASAKAYIQAINEYSIQGEVNELLEAVTAP